jgi:exopolyphosphatase / guanosine-5'-triphosphate,3'-diphosphate pyrophosphatase
MRLGVLDIGSNTGHLLVVDAYRGAAPMPASSYKEPLRLSEHVQKDGTVSEGGVEALTEFVAHALEVAEDKGCEEIYSFATSAVRDADNCDDVLAHVEKKTGVAIKVMPGEEEARLTFLAVRRWFGWSSGRLAVFDIGGGSLEVAGGEDESPDVAWSVPLGAGRLAREHLADGPPGAKTLGKLRKEIRRTIAHDAGTLLRGGNPTRAVATSKTFRSLARICGSAPSSDGLFVRRTLAATDLTDWSPKLLEMSRDEIADLPGVSASRAHQVVAGALVAGAVMDIFDLAELEICPWALREGVILDRLDKLSAQG